MRRGFVLGLCFVGWLIGWNLAESYKASAQSRVQYVSQCFNAYDDMIRGANATGRDNVQFVTVPSERNYGGIFGSPYCIIYKK